MNEFVTDTTDPEQPRAGVLIAFHHDLNATAMTEFVIAAPIFVFMFSAILRLYRFEELAVQGEGAAFALALQDFNDIQSAFNPIDDNVSPQIAAVGSGLYHRDTSIVRERDLALDLLYDVAPYAPVAGMGGTLAEQRSRLLLAGSVNSVADDVELDPAMLFSNVRALTNNMPIEPSAAGTDTVLTNDLLDDGFSFSSMGNFNGGNPMSFVNSALSSAGARPAIAAGIRYGVSKGKFDEESEEFLGRTWRVQSYSHIIAPPRPTSKWITRGIVHAYLAQDDWKNYNDTIPKFAMTPDLDSTTPEAQDASNQASACQSMVDSLDLGSISSRDDANAAIDQINNDPNCQGMSSGSTDFISGLKNLFDNAGELLGAPDSLLPSRDGGNMSTNQGPARPDDPFNPSDPTDNYDPNEGWD